MAEINALNFLRNHGFSDAAISYFQASPLLQGYMDTTEGRKVIIEHLRQYESQNPTAAQTEYETAVQELLPTIGGQTVGQPQPRQQPYLSVNAAEQDLETKPQYAPGGRGATFEIDPKTGAYHYANGTIVDPNAQVVYYKPNSSAPGSPGWWAKVQATWSDEEIATWRKKLYQMGYIATKEGGKDVDFRTAISEYYKQKYLNGGNEIAYSSVPGSGAEEIDRLHETELKTLARTQYRAMYGVDPTDEEVDDLSQWAQRTYTRLQRKRGYSPDRASSIVATQAEDKILEDPQNRFVYKQSKRNTSLQDQIVNAVQMTEMLA